MKAALRKGSPAGISEINSKHNRFSRSQFQRSVFLTLSKEKKKNPQDKMLSIPNYYRKNVNQNDKTSNPTYQNGHPHKSANNKCRRELGSDGTY